MVLLRARQNIYSAYNVQTSWPRYGSEDHLLYPDSLDIEEQKSDGTESRELREGEGSEGNS